ncbi:hypothetical protein ACC717_05100 [Rhizobium ruizarguesonis]
MKQLISFAIGAAAVIGTMFWLWTASLGSYRELSSYWIPEMYTVKARAAESVTGPKIIIMSGSNALFGLDSQALAQMIGKPVVNMASHAGLPFGFLAEEVMPHVNPGDTVVAPLEFEYYRRDSAPSDFEIINMESWGHGYAVSTPLRAAAYFRSTSMLRALRDYLSPIPPPPPASFDRVMAAATANARRGIATWKGYSAESVTSYGDMLVDEPSAYDDEDRNYITAPPRRDALREIASVKEEVEAKGATFFLTWPVFWTNPKFDLASQDARSSTDQLVSDLAGYGVPMHCDPVDFGFAKPLFFNTEYHLSLEGAERRTVALGNCLTGKREEHPMVLVDRRRHQAASYDKLAARR